MRKKGKTKDAPFLEEIFLTYRSFAEIPIFGTLHNPQNASACRNPSTT